MKSRYELFSSVNEMLLPETLGDLLGKQVTNVEVIPFPEDAGFSGSELSFVKTDADDTLVLKQTTKKADWFITTTRDHRCRSVTLYQYGLLDRLLPQVQHIIFGCSKEDNGWAILMQDVSAGILPEEAPLTSARIERALDTLGYIHTEFWNSSELSVPELGLCESSDLIGCFLPTAVHEYPNLSGALPTMIEAGWTILKETLEPDAFSVMEQLVNDPRSLYEALAQYPFTLVHGDFRTQNMSYMSSSDIVLFDWQLAARSLMTIDLCWFLDKRQFQLSTYTFEAAVQYYYKSLNNRLGSQFDPARWTAMLDLGLLSNTLRTAVFSAFFSRNIQEGKERDRRQANLKIYNDWIRTGLKWL